LFSPFFILCGSGFDTALQSYEIISFLILGAVGVEAGAVFTEPQRPEPLFLAEASSQSRKKMLLMRTVHCALKKKISANFVHDYFLNKIMLNSTFILIIGYVYIF
jgi:hypothetical protein